MEVTRYPPPQRGYSPTVVNIINVFNYPVNQPFNHTPQRNNNMYNNYNNHYPGSPQNFPVRQTYTNMSNNAAFTHNRNLNTNFPSSPPRAPHAPIPPHPNTSPPEAHLPFYKPHLSHMVVWHHSNDPYGPDLYTPGFDPIPLINPLINHPWEHLNLTATSDGMGLLKLKYAIRMTLTGHSYLEGTVVRAGHLIHAVLCISGRPVAIQRWVWRADGASAELLKMFGKRVYERRVGEGAAEVHAKLRAMLDGFPRGRSRTVEEPLAKSWEGSKKTGKELVKQGRLARLPLIEEEEEDEDVKGPYEGEFVGPAFVTAADYGPVSGVWVCTSGMGSDGLKGACEFVQEGNKIDEGKMYEIDGSMWKVEEVVTWQ